MATRIYTGRNAAAAIESGNDDCIRFPEVRGGLPLHPKDVIDQCDSGTFTGCEIITLSEHLILWFCREVRERRITGDAVEVYYGGKRLRLDDDGEFLDRWPDGFFDERGELLFADRII